MVKDETVMAAYDNVEMKITAPGGTVIDKDDPRYDAQLSLRLITTDGSGFEVMSLHYF